jgi:integrase
MAARREYGTGSIVWKSNTKVLLRAPRITDADGAVRHPSKTVRVSSKDHGGRSEASESLEAFIAEIRGDRSAATEASSRTLRDLMDSYVADRARIGRAKSTVETYKQVAKRLTDAVGGVPIDSLSPLDVDRFYGDLALGGMGANTIRQTHAVLSAALGWAVKKGIVTANVVNSATPPARMRSTRQRIEPADVKKMIQAALKRDDATLAVAIFLLVYAGVRRGEACGLRWSDFDITAGRLRCERQWIAGTGGQHLEDLKSDTGAMDGARIIDFAPGATDLLERYRQKQADDLGIEPDGWLLSYDGGSTPLRAKALTERVSRLGMTMGIDVSPHSFRRTADTQLVAAGVDVDTASRRQGHTKEVMLRHYVLGADDKAAEAAALLETRLVQQGLPIAELLSPPI